MTEISRPCPGSRANTESSKDSGTVKLEILILDKIPDLKKKRKVGFRQVKFL